ncbi:hypothetical protein [uncultured Chryseobacterium sp.]|uniref:hypothetical protein n=1 Tax=uncultured Chryseobacterium sp. TaxID=259322 RepID=UPI0025903F19|nr:hypothetical protein [uncultured Chryseobacterium sp.]
MAAIPSNLNQASGSAITAALSNLRTSYNGRGSWLDSATNKYVTNTIDTIQTDISASTLDNTQMADYMATSVLIHCFNGWTYLSNAVSSLLEGDHANSIHNAYYAELRSIISILGSQGIGVFNKYNVLINNSGVALAVTPYRKATHVFAKDAFDEWLNNPVNSQSILSLFSVDNSTLKDWLHHTGLSSVISGELAAEKLKQWSLDLSTIQNEQKFRNFVSYNPMTLELNTALADDIKERMKFIIDLWKLCGPSDLFGLSILRNSYENLYGAYSYNVKDLDMRADWERIFIDLGRDCYNFQNQQIIKFLKREINTADNLVFDYAENIKTSSPILESDVEPFGIISRACIMLLLNTKIVESILKQSGTSKADLKFWSDNIGIKSGFWSSTAEPDSFSDLWSDVELELEDIQSWINDPLSTDAFKFKNDLKGSTVHIRNFAKAYLWKVGI